MQQNNKHLELPEIGNSPELDSRLSLPVVEIGRNFSNRDLQLSTQLFLAGSAMIASLLIALPIWLWLQSNVAATVVLAISYLAFMLAIGLLASGEWITTVEAWLAARTENRRTAAWLQAQTDHNGNVASAIQAHREIELQRLQLQQDQLEANRQYAHAISSTATTLAPANFVSNVDQSIRVAASNYLTSVYANGEFAGAKRRLNRKGWTTYVDSQDLEELEQMLFAGPICELRAGDGTIYGYGLTHDNLPDALNALPPLPGAV